VNKTIESAAQLTNYILLNAYSRTNVNKNFIKHILSSWNNSIFGYKLRTDQEQSRLKILKSKEQPAGTQNLLVLINKSLSDII